MSWARAILSDAIHMLPDGSGVIAGDGDCSSGFGSAADGKRLKQFVNEANANGYNQAVFHSICDGDLTMGLKQALDKFQQACGQIIL